MIKFKSIKLNSNKSKIIVAGVVLVIVVGSGTSLAAQSSKPGELLYGVKLASEDLRLALSVTNGMEKSTRLSIANERVAEIEQLLSEKSVNTSGVQTALNELENEKSSLYSLASNQSDLSSVAALGNKAASLKSQVDKLFEIKQSVVESQIESLKQKLEIVNKAGDTAQASVLQAQINALTPQLTTIETTREAAKQQLEVTDKEQQSQAEAEKKAAEAQAEADKKAAEKQVEAEKKAAEAQSGADKSAAEAQTESDKKSSEH